MRLDAVAATDVCDVATTWIGQIHHEDVPALFTVNYRKEKFNIMSSFRLRPQLSRIGKRMRVIGLVDATSVVGSMMMGATNIS